MNMIAGSPERRALAVVLISAALVSCRDTSPFGPGSAGRRGMEFGSGAVRLSLTQAPGPEPGQITVTLQLVPGGTGVGSYQGTLRFPEGDLRLVDLRQPAPSEDEFRTLNSDAADRGIIRFAAFSLKGFSNDEVLTLVARPRRAGPNVAFDAALEVVADASGTPLNRGPAAGDALRPGFSLAANALGPAYIGLDAGSTAARRVDPGSRVAVPAIAKIDSAGGLALSSLGSGITWDAEILAFDSLKASSVPGWSFESSTASAGSGQVTFTRSGTSPLAATTTFVTAYFTADSTIGGTMVRLVPEVATNPQGESVIDYLRPRALALCVAPTGAWGDANNDGLVNVIDAQQIARHSAGLTVANPTAVTSRGDVTADAAVNIIDAQQVARFSVGLSAAARTGTLLYVVPETLTITTVSSEIPLAVGTSAQVDARTFAVTETTGCSTVTWTSSNTAVAVVNATGLVSGIAPGTATVNVISDNLILPLQVTVIP